MSQPNAVLELLAARHATRSIDPAPLPEEIVAELLEAARLTPSCYNKQPWRFLFLQGEQALARGREALTEGNRPWAGRAPLLVVGTSRKGDDCLLPDGRAYHQFDLGMAVMNLMLSATVHRLVARPMAGFDPQKIREAFALAPEDEPLVMLAIGRPASDEDHLPKHYRGLTPAGRERKPLDEIARRL